MEHGITGKSLKRLVKEVFLMFGFEKIIVLEKTVAELRERVDDMEAEIGVLRNEIKKMKK